MNVSVLWLFYTMLLFGMQRLMVVFTCHQQCREEEKRSGMDTIKYHTWFGTSYGKVTKHNKINTQESQEVIPFPAGDHKAAWNRHNSITNITREREREIEGERKSVSLLHFFNRNQHQIQGIPWNAEKNSDQACISKGNVFANIFISVPMLIDRRTNWTKVCPLQL